MSDFDIDAFGKSIGAMVREMIEPLAKRLEELEGRDVVKELLSTEKVDTLIDVSVAAYLEANPPAAGVDGKDGEKGDKGEDGVGVVDALIDRNDELVVTFADGRSKNLGKVVGRDGKDGIGQDGKDGRDGLSFDSVQGEYIAEKGYVLTLANQDRKTEIVLPYMTHKGFWREGMQVKAADSITHDGALWIAKRDNTAKPCMENSEDWQLAARKGRDGKDGQKVYVERQPVKLGAD